MQLQKLIQKTLDNIFARFVLVGTLNTVVDFVVLNILIFLSGFSTSTYFTVFKTASFIVATINSYLWNKYWTFRSSGKHTPHELSHFILVTLGSLVLNITIASWIVSYVPAPLWISQVEWANIASLIAVLSGLVWNFFGYKLFVFVKTKRS